MADFNQIIDKILAYEGGYVNDPDDAGGETFRGISRKFNKNWAGWKIIDKYKVDYPKTFKSILMKDSVLLSLTKQQYKSAYWDACKLDDEPNQNVANMIFDMGVNAGMAVAKRLYKNVKDKVNKYYSK